MKVALHGYYGFRNTGDEAILSVVLEQLRAEIPSMEPVVLSWDPTWTREVHGVEAVDLRSLPAVAACVREASLVLSGGGGLLQDYWPRDNAEVLAYPAEGGPFFAQVPLLARLYGKPLVLMAHGVGPVGTGEGANLVRFVMGMADRVTLRDAASLRLLESLGCAGRVSVVAPDPGFAFPIPPRAEARRFLEASAGLPAGSGLVLAACVRPWEEDGEDWAARLAATLDVLVASTGASVVFVPFQESHHASDAAQSRAIIEAMAHGRRCRVVAPRTPGEAAALVAGSDAVLAMRLHAAIFGVGAGVPVLALAYDPKVREVMQQAGQGDAVLPLRGLDPRKAAAALAMLAGGPPGLRERLLEAAARLAAEAAAHFRGLAVLVEDRASGSGGSGLRVAALPEIRDYHGLSQAAQRRAEALQEDLRAVEARLEILERRSAETAETREAYLAERSAHRAARAELAAMRRGLPGVTWRLGRLVARAAALLLPQGTARGRAARSAAAVLRRPDAAVVRAAAAVWRALGLPRPMTPHAHAFQRFRERLEAARLGPTAGVSCPKGAVRVSVVLPVHNGERYLAEAVESVLAQTFRDFELIVVDDGSTDGTPAILERLAGRDERIRVLRQENSGLPVALDLGFAQASGELLTWTSDDNRMKPGFLEKMVDCLDRHPSWDVVYANQDIIGPEGGPLRDSEWFKGYQVPPGSEHVHLPSDPSELNVWPNNYVGGAFLYRNRVPYLIGEYSPHLFGLEDYDYWMRANAVLNLRHADFEESVYEYRFHGASLTARDKELGITRRRDALMVFEEFRRDFLLYPSLWCVTAESGQEEAAERLRAMLASSGRTVVEEARARALALPGLWLPAVHLHVGPGPAAGSAPLGGLPPCFFHAFLATGPDLPVHVDPGWDLLLCPGGASSPPKVPSPWKGWLACASEEAAMEAAELRARAWQMQRIEEEIHHPRPPALHVSVVVCTYRRPDLLARTLRALAAQEGAEEISHEILVVDNDPLANRVPALLEELRAGAFTEDPGRVRLVDCPLPGLSFARNAAISEARGRILGFLDDDSLPRQDWLARTFLAFQQDPPPSVVGGRIMLRIPDPAPDWLRPDWYGYWSHFDPDCRVYREVEHWWEFPWGANWACLREAVARIGGFRAAYGRKGNDFWGGEELIAAATVRRLGGVVAVEPRSVVEHAVDPARFTVEDVRRTIRAGILVRHQAQRDLHLPHVLGVVPSLAQGLAHALAAVAAAARPAERRRRAAISRAYLEAAWKQAVDVRRRLGRPRWMR